MTLFFLFSCTVSLQHLTRSFSEDSDAVMAAIDAYKPDYLENIEKSLTNVNTVISTLTQHH